MKLANRITISLLALALVITIVFTLYNTGAWIVTFIENKDIALFAISLAPIYLLVPVLIFLCLLALCVLLIYFILGVKRKNAKQTKILTILLIIALPLPILASLQDDFPINNLIAQCLVVYIGLTALAAHVACKNMVRVDSIPS